MSSPSPSTLISLLRIALGALILQVGIHNLITSGWSPVGILTSSTIYPDFFAWFALPSNIGWVTVLCTWGIVVVGGLLILGLATRFAALLALIGIVMLYILHLRFPLINGFFIISPHIVYIIGLILISTHPDESPLSIDKRLPVKL